MSTQTGRTFVGSVLSIDLVGYSMRSVSEQDTVKQRFTRLLQQALLAASSKGRTILDTGDGALITFLGDPEQCFVVGLRVRDVMNAAARELGCAPGTYPVRLGIHLGSVKQSVGLSGNPSIVGDGVNVAECIVGFAEPGQIVVSRSFYDVVSRLSEAHAQVLVAAGSRTDKNGRAHEIFVVSPLAAGTVNAARRTGAATVSFKPRTVAIVAGALAATALAAAGGWFLLARKAPEPPAVAMRIEPPKVEPPKIEAAPAPVPEPRKTTPRSDAPRATPRPQNEGEKLLSALSGAARSVGSTVGSTTQNVLSSVGEKARTLSGSGGHATPVSRSVPSFPPTAAAQGIRSGTVRARVNIDAAGQVTHVDVLSSDPPRVFDQEAIRALNRWRFNTGTDGRTYETEVVFTR